MNRDFLADRNVARSKERGGTRGHVVLIGRRDSYTSKPWARLIRTKTDHGIVVILDNRIVTKPYGRAFMHALPKSALEMV